MDFDVYVPSDYDIVETDEVVLATGVDAYTHFLKFIADRHAEQLNKARLLPLYRYEVEKTTAEMREAFGWAHRWVCVPYKNVLTKRE